MDDTAPTYPRLAIPALASAGAAVLHAAAAGAHAGTEGLARVFIVLAVAQAVAAAVGFVRPDRFATVTLVVVNTSALLGWAVTRLVGLSWIDGLGVAQRLGLADTIAATLALGAAAASIFNPRPMTLPPRAIGSAAVLVGVLVVPGLVDATATRAHDHPAPTTESAADDGLDQMAQGDDLVAALSPALADDDHGDHAGDGAAEHDPDHDTDDTDHAADAALSDTTTPYDPALPIDLGGIEGVTLEQQAYAENLVAATVRDLPQWADLDVVEAAGFRSIGDGATGHEHYMQWDWIDDDIILDPDFPESLVFEPQPDGSKRLVSAMFMMPSGTPLDEVPDFGGALMQWHVHGDLCFTDDPEAPKVAGLKPVGASCSPPLVDGTLAPMIHVWIIRHECGPFAALDGIAGGQVPEGETILCDSAHGAH